MEGILFEQFSREWQVITAQDNFDGFRMEAGKNVTKKLSASHSLILGTSLREGGFLYQFGPTFQSGKSFATGRLGLDGTVNGRFGTQLLSDRSEIKLSCSSNLKDQQRNSLEIDWSFIGNKFASSFKVVHQGTWILNSSFSRNLTKNLSVGADITYIPLNGVSLHSFGSRFASGPHVISGMLSQQPDFKGRSPLDSITSAKIQYAKKISDRLSLGAEIEASLPDKDSALRVGYEYTFRQAKVQGLVDTAGRVSCFVSDFMGFGVSGIIDYPKSDYRFGFMMHIVPQPTEGV
jgi:mitochondrial import receptor subunit TOM40